MTPVRHRPLAGRRVVVTRAASQASALSERLHVLGATTIEVNTIAIEAPADGGAALRRAIDQIDDYDRIIVTSPNGARRLTLAVAELAANAAGAITVPVACVGPSTAAVLADGPFVVDVVPDRSVAESLVDAVGEPDGRGRALVVQAEVARDVVPDGLRQAGWAVDRVIAYRTVDGSVSAEQARAASSADLITFTSSSTVDRFVRLAGASALPPAIASIGPITSATVRNHGLTVDVEATSHTLDGLVDAVVEWVTDADASTR